MGRAERHGRAAAYRLPRTRSTGRSLSARGLDAVFGTAVTLPFKLATTAEIGQEQDYGERQIAEVSFTLLEILSAIYYALGNAPEHLNADQPRVEVEEVMREIFPEIAEEDEDEPPWQALRNSIKQL